MMPSLIITSVFPRSTFKPWLSKPPSIWRTYSRVPRLFHSSGLSHQHTANHLAHPLANSVTTSTIKRRSEWKLPFAAGSPTDTVGSQSFLYSSNTTSWRFMSRANDNNHKKKGLQCRFLVHPHFNLKLL